MRRTRNTGLFTAVVVFIVFIVFIFAGCPTDDNGGAESYWLSEVSNPFLGTWRSDVEDDGSCLTFIGKADGSFEYEMTGVPAMNSPTTGEPLPSSGTGAYLIKDTVMVSYFDFGLVKSNLFSVVDNNTVTMTEFTLNETTGKKVLGATTHFRRVGDAAIWSNRPTVLRSNDFIGTVWSAAIPEPESPGMSYPSTWDFNRTGTVIVTFLGMGEEMGFDGDDAPHIFAYLLFEETVIFFTESQEGNEILAFTFEDGQDGAMDLTPRPIMQGFLILTPLDGVEPLVFSPPEEG